MEYESKQGVITMTERKYKVLIDKEVAENMDIKTATILVRALFEEYYNDYGMTISIREMERCEECKNDDR